jgi:hypothetical protein
MIEMAQPQFQLGGEQPTDKKAAKHTSAEASPTAEPIPPIMQALSHVPTDKADTTQTKLEILAASVSPDRNQVWAVGVQ